MNIEIWKDIKELNNLYEISNLGRIRNKKTGTIRKVFDNGKGYYSIMIKLTHKSYKVHQLVAKYFVPNPNNYSCINHIDGVKTNNNANNLEWCTRSYNTKHGYDKELYSIIPGTKNTKKIKRIDINTNKEYIYLSIKNAKEEGYSISKISECLHKKRNIYKGCKWEIIE